MKILLNGLGARRGGAEVFLANLIEHLSTIDRGVTYKLLIPKDRRHVYGSLSPNVVVTEVSSPNLESFLKRMWF